MKGQQMRITEITCQGIKGIEKTVDVTAKNLLIRGRSGSGKSAFLDAVHLALELPTKHGKQNLDRLNATGTWTAAVGFGDGEIRRLERRMVRGKPQCFVNGSKVTAASYSEAIRKVLDVQPHHVDLGAFLGLSGEKRSAMFASMLSGDTQTTVEAIIDGSPRSYLENLVSPETAAHPMFDGRARAVLGIAGSPRDVAEAIKVQVNESASAARDARTHHDALVSQHRHVTHGANTEELKAKVASVDERLGAAQSKKADIESDLERHAAAIRVLEDAKQRVEQATQDLAHKRELAGKVDELKQRVSELSDKIEAARADREAAEAELSKAIEAVAGVEKSIEWHNRGASLVADVFKERQDICEDWLKEQFTEMTDSLGFGDDWPWPEDFTGPIMAFVEECLQEMLGGSQDARDTRLGVLNEQLRNARAIASNKETVLKAIDTAEAESSLATVSGELARCAEASESIEAAQANLEALTGKYRDLESSTTKSAPVQVESVLDAEIEALTEERRGYATQLRELEEAMSVSGQIEGARLAVAVATEIAEAMKTIGIVVQEWRDGYTKGRLDRIMGPFRESFGLMFPGAVVEVELGGTGRSTVFDFVVARGQQRVSLDLLSDGETVLAAAAFLSSLQKIREAPVGSIITMNTEGVDEAQMGLLIEHLPSLGMDHVMLANNRLGSGDVPGWQVVDMEA